MCLSYLYPKKKQKGFLKRRPKWLKVYKVVKRKNFAPRSWFTSDEIYRLKYGLNIASEPDHPIDVIYTDQKTTGGLAGKYMPLFHCWVTKKTAEARSKLWNSLLVTITCYVHREKITNVGRQFDKIVIVSSELIVPKHPNTELTKDELIKFGIITV